MNETILAISLSVVASMFYKIFGFDLLFDRNTSIDFILKGKRKKYVSFLIIISACLLVSLMIYMSGVLKFEYLESFFRLLYRIESFSNTIICFVNIALCANNLWICFYCY